MKKTSKLLSALTALLLTLSFVALAACNPKPFTFPAASDDGYELEIEGFTSELIKITKGEMKKFYNENADKRAIATDKNPIKVGDGTDENGNLKSYVLKGVYLDDILALYDEELSTADFSSLKFVASDGYNTLLAPEDFNESMGGSKIIIALEYEGETLTPSSASGALRAVLADKAHNKWAKFLKRITFGNTALSAPAASEVYFMETLPSSFSGTFNKGVYQYTGISVSKLLAAGGIFIANAGDIMYVSASDGKIIPNSYDVFKNAFFVYKQKEGSAAETGRANAPVFDSATMLSGMTVKGVTAAVLNGKALVSLDMLFELYANAGILQISKLFEAVGIATVAAYTVQTDGYSVDIIASDFLTAALTKEGENYMLSYGDGKIVALKSFGIKIITSGMPEDFPAGLNVNVRVYYGEDLVYTIINDSFIGLTSETITIANSTGTVFTDYIAFNLGKILENANITAGAFSRIDTYDAASFIRGGDTNALTNAYITVAYADSGDISLRATWDKNQSSGQLVSGVAKIVLTPSAAEMPEDFPEGLTVNIEIWQGGKSIGTITNASFAGLKSETVNFGRNYMAFGLSALLANAGINVNAFTSVTVLASSGTPLDKTYDISALTNTYITVDRLDQTALDADGPRFIANENATSGDIWKSVVKITFNS